MLQGYSLLHRKLP
ncbi:hypothetical protein FWK35_00002043 [Aphis craccivora]|uniref:Uncharacterized protein n=1 Tax=Aphis craccivora TaxID=307492 RepID=A0A6G0ZNU1_APHCR|nr:hypothetical protein FWK35_00002043 [Aphis craccivora]